MTDQEYVKTWPARYKANIIEVHESHRHQIWIASTEVRKVITALKADAGLEKDYGTDFRKLDGSRRVFFSERALRQELKKLRSDTALKFLAWLERDVYLPAARKRGDSGAQELMTEKPTQGHANELREDAEDERHIPARRLPPPPRPKLHREAQAKPPGILKQRIDRNPAMRAWRGHYDILPTFIWGGLVMLAWTLAAWYVVLWAIDPANYDGSYRAKQWLLVSMVPAILGGVVWWCVGVMRSVMKRQAEMRSLALGAGAFITCFVILLNALGFSRGIAKEWYAGWWAMVTDDLRTARVSHDPVLGRILVRGDTGWGSYKALEAAINMKPRLTLVELQGPGGYVVEGYAMARLIERHKLDTVVLAGCYSACTLTMVAGQERYLGPNAKLGFHRSGTDYVNVSKTWTKVDHYMADLYRSRGTAEDFVKKALDTPFNSLWIPSYDEVMASGYATRAWEERKSGY